MATNYLYNDATSINSEQEYTVNFTTNAPVIAFKFETSCYEAIPDWGYYYSTYSCPFINENSWNNYFTQITLPENINDSVSGTLNAVDPNTLIH